MTRRRPLQVCLAAPCVFAMLALAGCAKLPNTTGLPRGAQLVAETPDFKAGFTAPDDGTIYIFTRGQPSFLRYSGPIKKGQVFTLDPESNSATIDGKPLDVTVPGGGNHYQVFFRPASADMPDGGGGM